MSTWTTPWKPANLYDRPNTSQESAVIHEELKEEGLFALLYQSKHDKNLVFKFPIKNVGNYIECNNHYCRVINEVIRMHGEDPNDYPTSDMRDYMMKAQSLFNRVHKY